MTDMGKRKRNKKLAEPGPPSWLVVGARVDYCPVIGQPPTHRNMVVRAGPELVSGHTCVVWLEGKAGCVSVEACLQSEKEAT